MIAKNFDLKLTYWLLGIFIVAIFLRLIYFPGNVYFGSDQARDAFYSNEIVSGDFKVVGPGTTLSKHLHHGVLYYYIMGPVYFLANGNPYIPAFIVSLLNSFGVFVVFFIGKNIFNNKVGLFAAFLYAVSFEQTQYALFFSHPGLALIFVLLYYLGLSLLIFRGKSYGLILSSFCAGAATQLHFSLVILIIFLPIFLLVFKSKINSLKLKDFLLAFLALVVSMSTFIVAEIKYMQLLSFVTGLGDSGNSTFGFYINNFIFAVNRYIFDNLIVAPWNPIFGLILVFLIFGFLIFNKKEKAQGLFLLIWFLIGCIAYIVGSATTYYFGIGGSVSFLVAVAAMITFVWSKSRLLGFVVLLIIFGSNIYQIITINPKGPIGSIMAPPGLLLSHQQQVIDYIYSQAGNDEFSIHALTIPYNVKTTWDYLFNWYGMQKYGFVPVWGGEDALGSEGTLEVVNARSTLPTKQFLIIEPLAGLENKVVEDFLREESYFTHLKSEKRFGAITVQIREKY